MKNFTGRQSTGRAKSFGKMLLDGLDAVATAAADSPKRARIEKIDKQITELQNERDSLIAGLIEPGGLTVSDNYDPQWTPSETSTPANMPTSWYRSTPVVSTGEGRLTNCPGSWRDNDAFDKSHPGCPYRKTQHNKHTFTLRD